MNYDELLNISTEIGYRLLESGGEIYRVEESIQRIFEAYGIFTAEVFVIPSCIIVTVCDEDGHSLTKIRRIRGLGMDLEKVVQFNALCRRICRERPEFQEVHREIRRIDQCTGCTFWQQLFAFALISFSFTLFFGGDLTDACFAIFCGIGVKLVLHNMSRFEANSFFTNIIASGTAAVIALFFVRIGLAHNSDKMIIGTLMNLVPGIAITNVMRDIIAGDLIAGLIKLTEALLVATAIALGAGMAITLSQILL